MIFPYFNMVGGENSNISPFLIDPTQMPVMSGVNTSYFLGSTTQDLGYIREGLQVVAGQPILGAFNFIQSTDPLIEKMLVTNNNVGATATELNYKTDLGTWTNIAAATAAWPFIDMNVNMESFIGYCFFVGHNGTSFLPVASLTGTTFSTVTNVTGMPQAKFIVRYRDQLYTAYVKYGGTEYPFRVVGSGVPVAGVITWDTSASSPNIFDVDFSDSIVGISSNFDKLVVFTKRRTYFYDQTSEHQVFTIGAQNEEVIQNHSVYMIWANETGVWVSTGGQPQNVGGNIIDFIRNSDRTKWRSALIDEEYYLYIGDVIVDGVFYKNCWKAYNFQTNSWRGRELSRPQSLLAAYNSPTRGQRLFICDTVGNVWNKSKYSDAVQIYEDEQITTPGTGLPIKVNFEMAPMNLGDYAVSKDVDNLIAYASRAQGLKLKIRVIDRASRILTPWQEVGELTKYVNNFQVQAPKGSLLQIGGSAFTTLPFFQFYGYSLNATKQGDQVKPTNRS